MCNELTPDDADLAYSPSSVAANYREVIADYETKSLTTLRHASAIRVPYGKTPEEYSLLFEPEDSAPHAMLVFFHGGYWQELSAEVSCFPADSLLSRGYGYAAVNYTLAPHAAVSTIVSQCTNALISLAIRRPHTRIVIAGSSAGAHLAAMLMSMNWKNFGLNAAPFDGAVLISGIYDLRPLVATYINEPLQLNIESAAAMSPQLLPLRVRVPTVVCWGEHETPAFKQQSRDYAAFIAQSGAAVSHYEVANRNHFDILFALSDPTSQPGIDTFKLLGDKS
ncbi:alpha/beta hydrolase [Paraburkholderia phenoliruptrix]|uniref:alpha/beta hydrolase n=1 Tax=Paraburkholderia phenoliruptrix TaxID=252970 RepID=UPI00142EF82B|nr:alpha/beta hydrolase [Paraburkholderia phenoliruptrix]MBW0445812.1 alpha/beta hydrolase [Paraburkholderia phenoliruptrix]MBW9101666.1 alpha/beta hydrolase [Paraburkholderia phenoliruptrix]